MKRLQRHPLAMSARFRDAIVLTYAFPAPVLRALVPSALPPETYGDSGFVAVALVDMRGLRPSRLPAWAGTDAVFAGYRVFVRTGTASGHVRRGLKIIRTDVNRLHVLTGTKLLTRYEAGLISATWERRAGRQRVRIGSRWRGADLDVEVALDNPPAPPPGSPFRSWEEAAPFSGPLPWTFAPDVTGSRAVAVKGVRSDWSPEPVTVHSQAIALLSSARFAGHRPVLASAFHISDVAYSWMAGIDGPISAPGRGHS